MSIKLAKAAVNVWMIGVVISLAGCFATLAQVVFAAEPVGQRWPVYLLMGGGLVLGLAKIIEWHSRSTARRIVRDALNQAKR
ncbi:TPA: hypothetical protein ACKP9S_003672 [Pseudomonas aeruginosa]